MEKEIVQDVRNKIMEHLKNDDRNLKWLSDKTEQAYASLYAIFVQRTTNLSQERLDLINNLLGTKFKINK